LSWGQGAVHAAGRDAGDAFVLRDVAGNLFLIPDPKTLDSQSRKLLWPFVG